MNEIENSATKIFPRKLAADPRIFETLEKLKRVTNLEVMYSSNVNPSSIPKLNLFENSSILLIGSSKLAMIILPSMVDNSSIWLTMRGTNTEKKEMKIPQRINRVIAADKALGI